MAKITFRNLFPTVVCIVLAGCSYNVGNREPFQSVVGKTVYLRDPMKLWLPHQPGAAGYASYPCNLVPVTFDTVQHTAQGDVPDGEGHVVAMLPVGTPLHIEKVKGLYALDNDEIDALGTVSSPVDHATLRFAYNYIWSVGAGCHVPWMESTTR